MMKNVDMRGKFRVIGVTKKQKKEGILAIYQFDEKGLHTEVTFFEYDGYYLVQAKEPNNTDKLDLSMILHCFICSSIFNESKEIRFSERKQFSFNRDENYNSLYTKISELYPRERNIIIL